MSATIDGPTQSGRAARRKRWLPLLVVVGALVGGGVWWWREDGRHLFQPKNWGVVEEGRIYRSGRIHRRLIRDVLAEHKIEVVVDLAGTDAKDPNFQAERDATQALGLEHITFSGLNGYGLGSLDDYAQAFARLLEARRDKQPILVHCGGGSERTGAIFAWYRMLLHGWSGAEAWEEYLHYRAHKVTSDDLRTFVNANMPEIVRRMQALGLLKNPPDPLPVFGPTPHGG